MIAVAPHGVPRVGLRPFVEIEVIVVGVFRHGPTVEHLVHDQEAHRVAEVQEPRVWGIVRGADRVDAQLPELGQTPLPYPERHGRAKCPAVGMDADSLDLEVAAIEPEAGVSLETRIADPETDLVGVEQRAAAL